MAKWLCRMPGKYILIVAAVIAVCAALYLQQSLVTAGEFGFPLDDSWIHAHFARNIADGNGFVYNPGQRVASTAVLYTLLLSSLYLIKASPVLNAIILGLALHLGGALLIYSSARRLGAGTRISLCISVLFAANSRLVWGALAGMEVPLYVFLVCLGIYFHLRYRWYDGIRAYAATASFAAAALARPECLVIVILSLVERALDAAFYGREKGGLSKFLPGVAGHFVVCATVIAPAIIFNLTATGLPMPLPFYAKTDRMIDSQGLLIITDGLVALPKFLWQAFRSCVRDNAVISLALLLPGLGLCLTKRVRATCPGVLILPLVFVGVPAATALVARTGDGGVQLLGQVGRYSAYLVPVTMLISAVALQRASVRFRDSQWSPIVIKAVAAVVLVGVLIAALVNLGIMSRRYALQVQNINHMQVAIGKKVSRLPKGATLAANDVGAIAYFSRRPVIDTVGVISPEVFAYEKKYRNRQIAVIQFLKERKPDYVIIFPNWYPGLASLSDTLTPVASVRLNNNVVCGGDMMVIYRAKWK